MCDDVRLHRMSVRGFPSPLEPHSFPRECIGDGFVSVPLLGVGSLQKEFTMAYVSETLLSSDKESSKKVSFCIY